MEILTKIGAILKGHFLLSSGKHSDTYIQCAKIFENPKYVEKSATSYLKINNFTPVSVDCKP